MPLLFAKYSQQSYKLEYICSGRWTSRAWNYGRQSQKRSTKSSQRWSNSVLSIYFIYLVVTQPRKLNGQIQMWIVWLVGAVLCLEYLMYVRHFTSIPSNQHINFSKLGWLWPIYRCGTWASKVTWPLQGHTQLFSFFLFFSFIFISWRPITLQYCSGFCHTLTWISHGSTCIPHPDPPSHLPLHPIPLGLPSAPVPSTCLMHPAWAGDLFHPR